MIIRIKKIHIFVFALLLISVSFILTIKNEEIKSASSLRESINLPVVMYHHITDKKEKAGKYVITTEELENDFEYLNKCGYTTVFIDDLIKYTENKIKLPDKAILITFDDGFKSVYKLALPLLEKYNIKSVIAPVGKITEEYTLNKNEDINYAYLTWKELKALNEHPLTEIQSHTYDMHNLYKNGKGRDGMSKLSFETKDEYKKAISDDLKKMEKELSEKSNIKINSIAYPYGLYSKETLEIIKELGYKCNFLCEERMNKIIKGEPSSLYNLGRYNRPSGIDTEVFFSKMNIS